MKEISQFKYERWWSVSLGEVVSECFMYALENLIQGDKIENRDQGEWEPILISERSYFVVID